jgi:hypothetical protein
MQSGLSISDVQASFTIFAKLISFRMKKFFKSKVYYFLLGMLIMLVLDMIFHFNNSVERKIDRELNKAQKKIENALK